MNHFSALEVKYMSQQGLESMNRITLMIIAGIVMGSVTMCLLFAGFIIQFLHDLESYISILVSLFLMVNFYVMYELFRLRAMLQLRSFEPAKIESMIQSANTANKKYGENLKDHLERNGVETDDALDTDQWGILGVERQHRKSLVKNANLFDDENARLAGYKRVFFCLSLLLVFGALCCTILVSTPTQPTNHTPSMAPSAAPTMASSAAALFSEATNSFGWTGSSEVTRHAAMASNAVPHDLAAAPAGWRTANSDIGDMFSTAMKAHPVLFSLAMQYMSGNMKFLRRY